MKEAKLPRRDWVLLPMISLLTILGMLATVEFLTRMIWPEFVQDSCLLTEANGILRYRPNCKSWVKTAEGPPVVNHYNECGYRTAEPCGPKPPGTLRVAALGSSFSYGYLTPYNDAYSTLAAHKLTRQCKRNVEFQNIGIYGDPLLDIYHRTDEALALKPDLLLLAIDPFDLTKEIPAGEFEHRDDAVATGQEAQPKLAGDWLRDRIVWPLKRSRSFTILQHFMYRDPVTYANLYLLYGDNADYLRPPFSPKWQLRLAHLNELVREMSIKAQAASVPMAILIGPSEAQVAIANIHPRAGVDPGSLQAKIAEIAVKNHVMLVDPLPDFKGQSDVMSLYYPVNGHLSARGQKIVADALAKQLTQSDLPEFSGCKAEE